MYYFIDSKTKLHVFWSIIQFIMAHPDAIRRRGTQEAMKEVGSVIHEGITTFAHTFA